MTVHTENPEELQITKDATDTANTVTSGNSIAAKCQLNGCKKKVGVLCNVRCRCGKIFCTSHRFFKDHGCTFDYRKEYLDTAKKNMIVSSVSKLEKI